MCFHMCVLQIRRWVCVPMYMYACRGQSLTLSVFLGHSSVSSLVYLLGQGISLNPELIYSTNPPSPLAMGSSVPPPRSWDYRQAMTPPCFYVSGGILTLAWQAPYPLSHLPAWLLRFLSFFALNICLSCSVDAWGLARSLPLLFLKDKKSWILLVRSSAARQFPATGHWETPVSSSEKWWQSLISPMFFSKFTWQIGTLCSAC